MSKVKTNKTETTSTVKRGRPIVAGSKRQAVLAMRDAKRNAGIEIKRGRPAGTKKVSTEVTVEVKAKPSKAQRQAATTKKLAEAIVADVNMA